MEHKILIVDDDVNLRTTLRDLLEEAGYFICEASSGAEAVEAVINNNFSIILMDYNLSDKNGIEVIKDIRGLNKESKILMMTGHASLGTAIKAIQEAVYDFLIKPVDFQSLVSTINKACKIFELEQENKNLVEELKRKNSELDRMNMLKSRFMSMASHDLSNLLMTLQLSFEMLSINLKSDESQKSKLEYITESIHRITRLVNDLVDWAAIEKGKFRLEKSKFSISEALKSALLGWEARAQRNGISVSVEANSDLPHICADRRRLGQVIMNLVENAIRHTHSGGNISVKAIVRGENILFSVSDTGEGIVSDDLRLLFAGYYQGSTPAIGRLGLGLTIAQEIVKAHGGKIWAESAGRGAGASFCFLFPISAEVSDIKQNNCIKQNVLEKI